MAEWSNAAVLKTVDPFGSGGSNPSLSVILVFSLLFQAFISNMNFFSSMLPKQKLGRIIEIKRLAYKLTEASQRINKGLTKTNKELVGADERLTLT